MRDFCNCEHAQTLLEAIEAAWVELGPAVNAGGPHARAADDILKSAIDAHHEALLNYIENEG
ncbi:MAG: hypothetical protein AMS22_13055 [Thiotrichales bacterium SG8_50]|nr:MAG: hypothetical protein AMS22_13055 [Thiotrichales bacterium SG8_50]